MRYLSFDDSRTTFSICILVPEIRKDAIVAAYIEPFGIDPNEVVVIDLHQAAGKKKTPMAEMRAYIEQELQPVLDECQVQHLLIADAEYFKAFTKAAKVEAHLGYVMPSEFGQQKICYVPNYKTIFYDPEKIKAKIAQSVEAMQLYMAGDYIDPGNKIIHSANYPQDPAEIENWLNWLLLEQPSLTCDTENFSLKHYSAGIGTISFAWSKHEGLAFPVDFGSDPQRVRKALKEFFINYRGSLAFHSINYDVTVLIYQLFMKDILDTAGLLEGLKVFLGRDWDCTKLITYLATNSCAGNHLKLKEQAQEFSGNYSLGDDIKDITSIPLEKLLEYNLIDALSTWFVYEKHWDTLVSDNQLSIYHGLFKPCMWDIIQMQLTGMPVNMRRAREVNTQLESELQVALDKIMSSPIIESFTAEYLNVKHAEKMNAKWKKKRITAEEADQSFNPNSDLQMRALLFEYLDLPVINLTESKLPSTNGETIEALLNHTDDPEIKWLLEAFQLFTIIGTLTTTFMPSILSAIEGPDGWHYLFGNFNLGGTLSGRLSSSGPNLQNLPSTGKGHKIKLKYAKLIKDCFEAPPGWLWCGIDFNSLEDRISALTTKDPNKLKVYTDGYDGHSMRAYAYWPEKMPDIDGNSVESINSIAVKYKPLRDRSKNPTFTLTYQGTFHALVKKYAFPLDQAKQIEAKYHELYRVSDEWVNAQLDRAMTDGYITAAFGLRLRTPLLHQVIRGTSKTPYEAEAEGRTAGNALGQSWCLLNSRAGMEFNQKVRASKFALDIRPSAQIHDAQYFMIKDDLEAIMFANEHLVTAVEWQNDPAIWHDEVKLGGEFEIFWPNWNTKIGIPNRATEAQIVEAIQKATGG